MHVPLVSLTLFIAAVDMGRLGPAAQQYFSVIHRNYLNIDALTSFRRAPYLQVVDVLLPPLCWLL